MVGDDQVFDNSYPESRIISVAKFAKFSYDFVLIRPQISLSLKELMLKYAKQRVGEEYGMKFFGYGTAEYLNFYYLGRSPSQAER